MPRPGTRLDLVEYVIPDQRGVRERQAGYAHAARSEVESERRDRCPALIGRLAHAHALHLAQQEDIESGGEKTRPPDEDVAAHVPAEALPYAPLHRRPRRQPEQREQTRRAGLEPAQRRHRDRRGDAEVQDSRPEEAAADPPDCRAFEIEVEFGGFGCQDSREQALLKTGRRRRDREALAGALCLAGGLPQYDPDAPEPAHGEALTDARELNLAGLHDGLVPGQ